MNFLPGLKILMAAESHYDVKLVNAIKDKLISRKQTVAVGESVTSGHLQAGLSLATDAMQFFEGGLTAYNLGQKTRHLGIEPIHAMACNCVSKQVAASIAIHAAALFSSDWGISATGYASPDPENGIKNLFAYYSISFRGKTRITEKISARQMAPLEVQLFYTDQILKKFLAELNHRR
jgi:nicotinamide-nucleotide amidase